MILHKNQLDRYKINSNQPLLRWTFDPDNVFERLNSYLIRILDVNGIIDSANSFMKLGKIEIGGIKGRYLGERIDSILNEFHTLYTVFITNHSNLLEPSNKQFKLLKREFQEKITILEQKLSQILMDTFINCNSIESSIKIVEMFGNLLQRPNIYEQLAPQIYAIIQRIQMEISIVHNLFSASLPNDAWIPVSIANKTIFDLSMAYLTFTDFFLFFPSSTMSKQNTKKISFHILDIIFLSLTICAGCICCDIV